MLSNVIQYIKNLKASFPRRVFRRNLWARLDAVLPPITRKERAVLVFRRVAIGVVSILPVLFFGTSAYAYSSNDVTEGTVLYPVKRSIERVEMRFVSSEEGRAAFHAKMYERRINEIEKLLHTQTDIVQTFDEIEAEHVVLESLRRQAILDAIVQESLAKHIERMQLRYETVRARVYTNIRNNDESLRR